MMQLSSETQSDPAAARRAAMDLLARREHSRQELARKLGRRFSPEVLQRALEQLAHDGLQSDRRFAESYVYQRCERGYGPLRLLRELRERGVDAALADAAVNGARRDWRALAQAVLARKFGSEPPADRRELARRLRFLQYRGFDTAFLGGAWTAAPDDSSGSSGFE